MLNKLPLPSGLTCFTSNYRDTRVNPRRKNFPARNDTQIYLVVDNKLGGVKSFFFLFFFFLLFKRLVVT